MGISGPPHENDAGALILPESWPYAQDATRELIGLSPSICHMSVKRPTRGSEVNRRLHQGLTRGSMAQTRPAALGSVLRHIPPRRTAALNTFQMMTILQSGETFRNRSSGGRISPELCDFNTGDGEGVRGDL